MRGLRVKRVVLCLVVGVVATWVSAWGIVARYVYVDPGFVSLWRSDFPGDDERAYWRPPSYGEELSIVWTSRLQRAGVDARVAYWDTLDPAIATLPREQKNARLFGTMSLTHHSVSALYGWPALALRTRRASFYARDARHARDQSLAWTVDKGLRFSWPKLGGVTPKRHALPLRPVWPGFLNNTLVYAGACWILLAAPGGVRRWRRKRNGQCAACGYDLKDLDTCPECGA